MNYNTIEHTIGLVIESCRDFGQTYAKTHDFLINKPITSWSSTRISKLFPAALFLILFFLFKASVMQSLIWSLGSWAVVRVAMRIVFKFHNPSATSRKTSRKRRHQENMIFSDISEMSDDLQKISLKTEKAGQFFKDLSFYLNTLQDGASEFEESRIILMTLHLCAQRVEVKRCIEGAKTIIVQHPGHSEQGAQLRETGEKLEEYISSCMQLLERVCIIKKEHTLFNSSKDALVGLKIAGLEIFLMQERVTQIVSHIGVNKALVLAIQNNVNFKFGEKINNNLAQMLPNSNWQLSRSSIEALREFIYRENNNNQERIIDALTATAECVVEMIQNGWEITRENIELLCEIFGQESIDAAVFLQCMKKICNQANQKEGNEFDHIKIAREYKMRPSVGGAAITAAPEMQTNMGFNSADLIINHNPLVQLIYKIKNSKVSPSQEGALVIDKIEKNIQIIQVNAAFLSAEQASRWRTMRDVDSKIIEELWSQNKLYESPMATQEIFGALAVLEAKIDSLAQELTANFLLKAKAAHKYQKMTAN